MISCLPKGCQYWWKAFCHYNYLYNLGSEKYFWQGLLFFVKNRLEIYYCHLCPLPFEALEFFWLVNLSFFWDLFITLDFMIIIENSELLHWCFLEIIFKNSYLAIFDRIFKTWFGHKIQNEHATKIFCKVVFRFCMSKICRFGQNLRGSLQKFPKIVEKTFFKSPR